MYSCCCIDVDEPIEVFTQKVRTARKPHRCGECGHEIQPGEEYEDFRGLSDGHWETYHTCWFCLKVREDFFECGWYFGMLREHFQECNGWDYINGPQPDDLAAEEDEDEV